MIQPSQKHVPRNLSKADRLNRDNRFCGLAAHIDRWRKGVQFNPENIKDIKVQILEALIREATSIQQKKHPFANMRADEEAVLHHEFSLHDVARLMPGRSTLYWSVKGMDNNEPTLICETVHMDRLMVRLGFFKKASTTNNFTLTAKALNAMGFDRETMKTTFSEINLSPVQDPVIGLLKAIQQRFETAQQKYKSWVDFMKKEFKLKNPFSISPGNLNEGMNTPQVINFWDYLVSLEQSHLVTSHLVADEGEDHIPYKVYQLTDQGLEKLKEANS